MGRHVIGWVAAVGVAAACGGDPDTADTADTTDTADTADTGPDVRWQDGAYTPSDDCGDLAAVALEFSGMPPSATLTFEGYAVTRAADGYPSVEAAAEAALAMFESEPPDVTDLGDLVRYYASPVDLGGEFFIDRRTLTIVYSGSIVYSGTGRRLVPRNLLPADNLLFYRDGVQSTPDQLVMVHGAWDHPRRLEDVWHLAEASDLLQQMSVCGGHEVVVWAYTPTVGEVDERAARGVVLATGSLPTTWDPAAR